MSGIGTKSLEANLSEDSKKELSNGSCEEPNAEMLRLLECPVCCESMFAPIEQCANGHSLCGGCRKDLSCCPVCRGPLSGTRNHLAEDLATRLLGRPCENAGRGCPVRLPGPKLGHHQPSCEFRPYKCLLCRERQPRKDLVTHYREVHDGVVDGPTARGVIDKDCLSQDEYYGWLMEAHDELFWFWWLAEEDIVYLGVDLCGQTGGSFSYYLELQSAETRDQLVFSLQLHLADDHKLTESLSPCEKCVCATRKFLERGTNFNLIISKE